MLVCALGDLLLDVVVRLAQGLTPGDDASAETHVGAGGQAANVAAWAAALGGRGCFLGKRAADAAGALVSADVEQTGAELEGPLVSGRTGVVVSIVGADGERTMASDRGVAPDLAPEELDAELIRGWRTLHISGYSLVREPIGAAAELAAEIAHEAGMAVSVDVSSRTAVRDFGADRFGERLRRLAPDVVFATEDEREILGGELPAETWVLKRGAAGCLFARDGVYVELPAVAGEVVDSTGAGDALAAAFLLGGPLDEAARRAMDAAARCVSKLGSMP